MKIVTVTGAAGFIGSNLTFYLRDQGYRVLCPVRSIQRASHLRGNAIECFEDDLQHPKILDDLIARSEVVFHLAGTIKGVQDKDYYNGNLEVTKNVVRSIKNHGKPDCRLVYLSSQAAAGPCIHDHIVSENNQPLPVSAYGRSKLAAENHIKDHLASPSVILRPSIVFGPRDLEMLQVYQYASFRIIPTAGFRRFLVNIIYIEDLVRVIHMAAENNKTFGNTYFVHDGNVYDWADICHQVGKSLGKKVWVLPFPMAIIYGACLAGGLISRLTRRTVYLNLDKWQEIKQEKWLCDCHQLKNDLDFRAKWKPQDALNHTARWYIANKWL